MVAGGAVVAGGRWRERLRQAFGFVVVCQRVIAGDENVAVNIAPVQGGVGGENGGKQEGKKAHGGFGTAGGFTYRVAGMVYVWQRLDKHVMFAVVVALFGGVVAAGVAALVADEAGVAEVGADVVVAVAVYPEVGAGGEFG